MTKRLILQLMAGAVAVLTFILGFVAFSDSAFRYRVLGLETSLDEAIENNIKHGQSLESVISILGPPNHYKTKNWIEIQMESNADRVFKTYPEGISERDVFASYRGFNQKVLQFRNGYLINF